MTPISVRIPHDIDQKLTKLSKQTGRPKNFYIREAIEDHIEDIEDYFLGMKTLRAAKRVYTSDEAKSILFGDGVLED